MEVDAAAGMKRYKYTPREDAYMRQGKGYWVYASEAGNLTMPGVGGSLAGETYAWADLTFVNGSGVEKNVTDAFTAGWIGDGADFLKTVYYWDPTILLSNKFAKVIEDDVPLDSWEGYFIQANTNLTMLRQD